MMATQTPTPPNNCRLRLKAVIVISGLLLFNLALYRFNYASEWSAVTKRATEERTLRKTSAAVSWRTAFLGGTEESDDGSFNKPTAESATAATATLEATTSKPTSATPSTAPSASPSKAPSASPSLRPSAGPTQSPSSALVGSGESLTIQSVQRGANNHTIEIDPEGALTNDVLSIHHNAQQAKVVVTFKADAKCPRPFLIGRLSGPTLVKIEEWTWLNQTDTTALEGTYLVPVGGLYFLEIIALFCNDFLYEFNQQAKQEKILWEETSLESSSARRLSGTEDWASNASAMANLIGFDFSKMCVEKTSNHRLTAKNATIWVEQDKTLSNQSHHPWSLRHKQHPWAGFWWHKNWTLDLSSSSSLVSTMMQPVFTRYQPEDCFWFAKKKIPGTPECAEISSNRHFEDYEFRWWPSNRNRAPETDVNPDKTSLGELDISMLQQPEETVICMVGFSHSANFVKAAERMGINATTANITIERPSAQWPNDVTPKVINLKRKWHPNTCNKLVIGVGQWPASFKGGRPELLDKYYQDTKNMIKRLKEDDSTKHMDIFLRSIHYNPLGWQHSSCSPKDWRNPAIIDAYNVVIERVCQEMNVPFLDTRHIDGHLWDSARDWNHLPPAPEEVDLLYLTAAVLRVASK